MDGLFIAFIFCFFIVFLFLLVILITHVRGEVVRLWVHPVSYFRNIRYNRPLRIKIRHRSIAQTRSTSLVKTIDKVIFKTEKKEGQSETINFKESADDVSPELFEMWKVIRKQPQNFTIWGTSFVRRWRTKDGTTGRWVFVFHLYPLEEMTKRLGRHKLIQGILLEKPLDVHTPPTRDEWLIQRIREDRAKGVDVKTLERRIKSYKKEYRRISKEKWLNLVFHPSVTTTKEAEITDRLIGFENVMSITAHAMNVLGPQLAKYKALAHYALGREAYERELTAELHETADRLGDSEQLRELEHRAILEARTPLHISTEGAPYPVGFPSKPTEAPKPSPLKMPLPENFWIYVTIFSGFFLIVLGLFFYATNPSLWGVMLFGTLLFMFGVFLHWREGKKVKVAEIIKEKVKEGEEAVKGE